MWGNIVGVSLILLLLSIVVSLAKLLSGKPVGFWGKIVRASVIVFTVAFIVWGAWEVPNYEKQQARINYELGRQYRNVGDYENALLAFSMVSSLETETHRLAQIQIYEVQMIQAEAWLNRAKDLFNARDYSQALMALKQSLSYIELEEAKDLLPQYESAAR